MSGDGCMSDETVFSFEDQMSFFASVVMYDLLLRSLTQCHTVVIVQSSVATSGTKNG